MNTMMECMGGGHWMMALMGVLSISVAVLLIAALIKYLRQPAGNQHD
nr:hypothetical protein [Marinobacterium profundum]